MLLSPEFNKEPEGEQKLPSQEQEKFIDSLNSITLLQQAVDQWRLKDAQEAYQKGKKGEELEDVFFETRKTPSVYFGRLIS